MALPSRHHKLKRSHGRRHRRHDRHEPPTHRKAHPGTTGLNDAEVATTMHVFDKMSRILTRASVLPKEQ
ncbi:hypothetical protein [Corynebacterium sp. H130]|uniref:hypothetical protein n=1 Tax=Corynebacterium sp. H130 TaxID=3133444 RepID=UPI0030A35370